MKLYRILSIGFPVALSAALIAVYWLGLFGGFAFDDFGSIVENRALRMVDGSVASLLSAAASGVAGPMGRGLSMISFALNYYFFGESPLSFKVANLGIHYANSMLVLVMTRQVATLAIPAMRHRRAWGLAVCVSTMWAMHPMNALPILLAVQRMTSLAAFFMLAGSLLYLYGRTTKTVLGSCSIALSLLVCWPAAIYSKETGLLFPVYLAILEWLLLGTFQKVPGKVVGMQAVLAGAVLLALCWMNWGIVTSGYRVRDFTLQDRLLTEPRVLWFYVQQLLWPMPGSFGLYHDDIPISRGLLTPPETLAAIAGWIAVATTAYWQRARWPLFAFAVFWFLASHLLESTILPLEIAHEHRNYLASFGLFLWLNSMLLPGKAVGQWRLPRIALLLGFVVFCGFVTTLRASQWADDFNRRQVEAFNHPRSVRANYELAMAVMSRTFDVGRGSAQAYELAHTHLLRAAALDSSEKAALLSLLYLDCVADKPQDAATIALAVQRFSTQPFSMADRNLVHGLSTLLIENKLCLDDQQSQTLINAGLANPRLDRATRALLYTLAMDFAVVRWRSIRLATEYAQAAITIEPSSIALRINLIHLYLQSGKVDQAKQEYLRLETLQVPSRDKPGLEQIQKTIEATEHHAPAR